MIQEKCLPLRLEQQLLAAQAPRLATYRVAHVPENPSMGNQRKPDEISTLVGLI